MTPPIKISVVVPCRNEEIHISGVLDSLLSQDYPKALTEIFIVDGMSEDRTREIVESRKSEFTHLELIENPKRITPVALNLGIKASTGDYIIRLDAHSTYPADYFSRLIALASMSKADNVGGLVRAEYKTGNQKAQAIAGVVCHKFGVGNVAYRMEGEGVIEADTVPFGCFPRDLFDRIGFFDEQLVRNQDDEFNARIRMNGGKVLLIRDLYISYFPRDNFKALFKQYKQYGYWKVFVNRKLKTLTTIRQLVPFFFVLFLIGAAITSILWAPSLYFSLPILALYLFLASIAASKLGGFKVTIYAMFAFLTLHLSYGWGYLKGVWRFLILQRKNP